MIWARFPKSTKPKRSDFSPSSHESSNAETWRPSAWDFILGGSLSCQSSPSFSYNASDNVAGLMTKTFMALLDRSELNGNTSRNEEEFTVSKDDPKSANINTNTQADSQTAIITAPSLHYNIQIHLPPTKDVEVYNAIFKSLKEHLIAK